MNITEPKKNSPLILVVDDDNLMRVQMRHAMEKVGYQVIEAVNGEQGLLAYKTYHPDIVLLDTIMPIMDGFTCCQLINSLPGSANTPILMIASMDDEASVNRAFAVGAIDYLTKPINWAVLCQRVRHLIVSVQVTTERQQAEKALIQAKAELEIRVAERTADLQNAVVQLEAQIAERQRVEKALRKSEERFRNLVETTSDCVWEIDENAVYTYVSPKVYDILGYEATELIGKTIFELMPPEEAWRVASILGPIANVKKAFAGLEKIKIHKDGHLVVLETGGVPIFNSDNLFRGYRGIDRDITSRKRAESVLRQHALAFDNIYDAIIITDWQGRIVDCNHSAERVFGYSLKEVLGKTFTFLYQQENCTAKAAEILEEMIRNDRWTGEINFIHKDGTQGVCEASFVPVYNDFGEGVGAIGFNHDITSRKQAEVEIIKALEKEKELVELRSRFITMASHEFRTPLATILTSSELLKTFGYKMNDDKKLQNHRRIETAVKKMTNLLEDILLINKAESQCIEFNTAILDLEAICRETIEEIKFSLSSKYNFKFACQGECSQVEIDEKLLRQMLTNLVSNAAKYSPRGGTIYFDLICENEKATFKVRDEGIGIPEADKERIFERFHRASNVGSISGTGLGLSIIKQAVELHGGSITLESEVGVGTTFTVCINTSQSEDQLGRFCKMLYPDSHNRYKVLKSQ